MEGRSSRRGDDSSRFRRTIRRMIPEETVHSTGINRQAWIGNLSTKDMAQYLSRNLSVSTLKSPDQLFNWLSDIVDNDGRFLEEGNQVK